jgi:Xaa-Pro aminopeptidase
MARAVILETLGKTEGFWIDINRTAVIGKPSNDYQALRDCVPDCYLTLLESVKPGFHTGLLPKMGIDYMRSRGIRAPEKMLVFAHGVGMMPVESPVAGPSMGTAGARGFVLEENMENVIIIRPESPESLYRTPLALLGPR